MNQRVAIQFPFEGQSAIQAYSRQPPLTSEDMLNMRPRDPKTDRVRGAQRAGLSKYVVNPVSGANPVTDIGTVVGDNDQIDYAILTLSNVVDDGTDGSWSDEVGEAVYSAVADGGGNFYAITGAATWVKYNPQGWKLAEKAVPVLNSSGLCRTLAVDSEQSVYVGVSLGGSMADARIYKYQLRFDGDYELAYSGAVATEQGAAPGTTAFVTKLYVKDDVLYAALNDTTNVEAEVQRYDAINDLTSLPATADLSFVCDDIALGLCVNSKGEILVAAHAPALTSATLQTLTKYTALGAQVWQVTSTDSTANPLLDGSNGGIGHAVAVDSNDNVYTVGMNGPASTEWLYHWTDAGLSVDADWNVQTTGTTISQKYGRTIAVDSGDNVYVAITSANVNGDVYVYSEAGAQRVWHTGSASQPLCVAIDPAPLVSTIKEFVFYGTTAAVSDFSARRARLMSATLTTGTQRVPATVAVCNGNINVKSGSIWATATGGTGALDATGEFIAATNLFGKRYFTDGRVVKVFDPTNNTVSDLIATAAGGVPQKCKVLGAWRGRLVLARPSGLQGAAHQWYMSAIGRPGDWNFNRIPPVPSDSAVDGVNSDVGGVPDIINCFIPWSDDLAFWGGDHSIWRMTGDPLAGGQIDDVSRSIGIAFGNRSWTRDAAGRLYFMSTEGDVYRLTPPGQLENISADSINRPLRTIDLTAQYAILTWCEEERGLYVHVVGRTAFGTKHEHYFWSDQTGGWFPLKYGTSNPRSVATLDGDAPGDRALLLGCEDGVVRQVDPDAKDDDGTAIQSYVFLGPYGLPESGRALRVYKWQVTLSGTDQGVTYELYGSNTADDRGEAVSQGVLYPGKNTIQYSRARGEFFWIKLQSKQAQARWAFETGWMQFATAGRQRV